MKKPNTYMIEELKRIAIVRCEERIKSPQRKSEISYGVTSVLKNKYGL